MSHRHQTIHRFQTESTQSLETRYLLFLPAKYHASSTHRWPMILFLHGAGERGVDLDKVAKHGLPKLVQRQADFPFVVASPQCPSGEHWSNDVLLALLENLCSELSVDRHRVYLTGLSMGGYGTWSLALARPELFAAVAPICGGGSLLPILLAEPKKARELRRLPVWAFHGADDPVVPLQESERMVQGLRQIGNQSHLTVYPNGGHDVWTKTYEEAALYDWFLRHQSTTKRAKRSK